MMVEEDEDNELTVGLARQRPLVTLTRAVLLE